ncbi:MAG: hypothetical protein R2746_13220 [Acidimicrobiales bacterium]
MSSRRFGIHSVRVAQATGHLLVALAVTAPSAWHPGRLPLGTEPVATVPRFNLWTLSWTADRLPHGLAGWWDAPIFWPTTGTFAFSEPQPLTGLAFALARPLVGAAGAYTAVLVATVALNGLAGAALARRLGADRAPAFLAGVLAQALPFAMEQLGVLQLLAVWPLLAATAALLAWAEEPRRRHAVAFGLALAAAVGTCGYYALLYGGIVAVAIPLLADGTWRAGWRRRAAGAAVAAVVLVLLTGPVAIGQQRRLAGHRWSDATIWAGSAPPSAWLPGGERWPGWPLVVLAAAGLVVARRHRTTRFLGALAVAAVLASLGTRLSVLGVRPWGVLVDHVAAVARLRSPYRAAVLAELALVGLAVPALQALWHRRGRLGRAGAGVGVALAVLAASPGAGRLVEPAPEPGGWAAWLEDHGGSAPVAFLPFASGRRAADFEDTTVRMLQALPTGHPMVNGYSGFFPDDHDDLRRQLRSFPDERSVAALQARDVHYVVVASSTYDRIDERIARELGFTEVMADDDAHLLRMPTG